MSSSEVETGAAEMIRAHARFFDTELQAVIGTTLGGEIVHWNRAAERIYGWSPEQVIGRLVTDVTPSDLSREEGERILRRLQEGRSWTGSFMVRSMAGEEFRVSVRDVPLKDLTGELIGIIGISTREPGLRHLQLVP